MLLGSMDICYYGNEIDGTFYDERITKINQTEFRAEDITKTKYDKLYVKRL